MDDDNELLVRLAKAGDPDAFAQLVAPHLVQARRVAVGAGAADDADDAVQNALIKAHRALGTLEAGSRFAPWFMTIVKREALNQGRSARRFNAASTRLQAQPIATAHASADEEVLRQSERRNVLDAVATLNTSDRAVIQSRFLDEHTEAETAEALGLPVGTVKSRTSRAMRRLRVVLVVVVIVAVAIVATPARKVVANWLGLRGVRIVELPRPSGQGVPIGTAVVESVPSSAASAASSSAVLPSASVASPAMSTEEFGQTTTLDQARKAVPFTLALPHAASLGDPELVTLDRVIAGGLVTLWWSDRPGVPVPAGSPTPGWAVALSEFKGSVEDYSFTKGLPAGSTITSLSVNGVTARWIAGAPHSLFISPNGQGVVTSRLAGNTLLWQRGDITYRLEGSLSQAAAVALAETVA